MSQCKKFAPNIFHKTKCSNCFRQKEEHSAEALECNRASRSIARSGYLFVAPDWDFSVPLNRTKRWQRRWFVLYDDGELNYSVDEHPDTVPQGSVDMSQVLEVTGAEQVTGHPHSLALTGPDRVTFVKAASREDARWWAELLAVFPRRHKRNATFPGGRASPSLPQLGRSASPQPPRPRHLSCTGPSPRTNFTTPPLKEERESPVKEDAHRPSWVPKPTSNLTIDTTPARSDYVVTSGSPPTRDKLRCEDKTRTGRDWRNERLRDIATALTDRSPESSLPFPAEGVLNLKKGWLWYKDNTGEWLRRWWVLCGSTLKAYRDQDEQGIPEVVIELATIAGYCEVTTEIRYGFQVQCAGQILILSAVTSGIRSNWLQALKKAAPVLESPPTPATPRSSLLSSDEEYRTASEGGRRDSEDWGELPPSPPLTRNMLAKVKEKTRLKSKLPRNQSRQSTVDSVSTDELEAYKEPDTVDLKNTINRQTVEMEGLRQQYSNALNDIQALEAELTRFKKLQTDSLAREKQTKELLQSSERIAKDLTQKLKDADDKHLREQTSLQSRLLETERVAKEREEKYFSVSRELQAKQKAIASMQEELNCVNEKHMKSRHENDRLYKKVQEMECKPSNRRKHLDSLTDLTDIDLDADLENLAQSELIEQCLDLRSRFEKAVVEIRAVKRELRESHIKFDQLELENLGLKKSLELAEQESQTQCALMAERVQDLTTKLAAVEKQARNLKSKLQDSREKRRSLSLKGRESCSINKEVEDKVTELEAKILNLERNRSRRKHKRERSSERASPIDDRSLRRLRRKSLDSVTASEPMKLLVRLSNLENKVTNITTSNESLNTTTTANVTTYQTKTEEADVTSLCAESIILAAKEKLTECRCTFNLLKNNRSRTGAEAQDKLEASLSDLSNILSLSISESEVRVIEMSAGVVVKHLETLLREKLLSLREKARALKESNQWSNRAKLELLAEKLAFESIIITRIKEALYTPVLNERLLNKEAVETASLLSSIQGKLNGVAQKQVPQFKTSVEYLTKVLAKRLVAAAHGFNNLDGRYIGGNSFSPVLKYLENERDKVSMLLCTYKSNKLPQLAESLACETMSLADDQTCHLSTETVNDIWKVARETVNTELIQSEISHVLVRTAQAYEDGASTDQNYFFSFFACERAALELWSDSVELQLQVEVEKNIEDLTEAYKASLSKLQRSRRVDVERRSPIASILLNEFADILAHKALIDARISVLKSECGNTGKSNQNFLGNSESDDALLISLGDLGITRISPSVEAEFKSLFAHYSGECEKLLEQSDLDDIRNTLQELSGEICELIGSSSDEQVRIASVRDIYYKCLELKRRVMEVKSVFLEMKNSKKYDNEEDRRPLYLGTEYLNQVENLRAAYRCTLADCENRKQQADLEQLQVLCERVLVAMEHWHRRTLQDLREQHSRELHALRQDKEQALAEETQATLAALDAMRKAHEAEVQREVAKFKQDFARQQQDELLELTERLSVKCLEAAALEEQLGSATRQLAHAQRHILQLERNPQFSVQN